MLQNVTHPPRFPHPSSHHCLPLTSPSHGPNGGTAGSRRGRKGVVLGSKGGRFGATFFTPKNDIHCSNNHLHHNRFPKRFFPLCALCVPCALFARLPHAKRPAPVHT